MATSPNGTSFFGDIDPIRYAGPDSDDPLSFRWYDADRVVAGRTMGDHLRFAVCYWHSFTWDGFDIFGDGTLDRPWTRARDRSDGRRRTPKMDAAFEFFAKLGAPFCCFHDLDIAPEGDDVHGVDANLDDDGRRGRGAPGSETGVELLWGTANLFGNRRYRRAPPPTPIRRSSPTPPPRWRTASRRRTVSAATTTCCGAAAKGYETLLNTDLGTRARPARHGSCTWWSSTSTRSASTGTILIEPKPFEPTKHQYDYDVATVHAFLQRYDLADEIKVNIEVNHATLAGHDFAHEIAAAVDAGIFGSIDANAGDDRLGWDVDRFPVSVEQMTLGDARDPARRRVHHRRVQLRRQAAPPVDRPRRPVPRPHRRDGHDGPSAAGGGVASSSPASSTRLRDDRYAGWDGDLGAAIMDGSLSLPDLHAASAVGSRAGAVERPPGAAREPRRPPRRTGSLSQPRSASSTPLPALPPAQRHGRNDQPIGRPRASVIS